MLICITLSASCTATQISPTPETNMPNPASVYCEQNGGRLDLRQDPAGGVAGVCIFPDGSECDEWAYFRGECQPGSTLVTPEPSALPVTAETSATPAAEFASDGCKIYRDEAFGYSFDYPAEAEIVTNDNPLGGISVVGPVQDGESWPFFSISHPSDREEYRPPENADLLQWLRPLPPGR